MPQLLVRNLDEELVRDLKKRAGEHGISVEEEHRRILREALRPNQSGGRKSFWQVIGEMPDLGDEDLFERDRHTSGRATEQPSLDD